MAPMSCADLTEGSPRLDQRSRQVLLGIARDALCLAVREGTRLHVPLHRLPASVQQVRGSFVTLTMRQQLRGCIGSLSGRDALAQSIADHSYAAALGDPRFTPVREGELAEVRIELSVLTPLSALIATSESELLAQLRPYQDGLVIEDGVHRATFLPKVWETLPEPTQFLRQLKCKAGLPAEGWSPHIRVLRYESEQCREAAD
jgi:AmmeMemoRadiSam system protein A